VCLERDRNKVICNSTMWRYIRELGFTRHKLAVRAQEQSLARQAEYILELSKYRYDQLVFIDEVHTDKRNSNRSHGWATVGGRVSRKGYYMRGEKYSSIAILSLDGILAHYSIPGGFKTDDLMYFLKTFVVPVMHPFPHPNSVLVIDNASIHHSEPVESLLRSHGIRILFLPPYSPTFNPIENAFSKLKGFIQRNGRAVADAGGTCPVLLYLAFSSITREDARGYFRHCGYFVK